MKKWDDLNKLIDKDAEKEMDKELLEYFYIMKQKPNFDKSKEKVKRKNKKRFKYRK